MKEIPDKKLVVDKLPPPESGWREIGRFALTFNGYDHWGSVSACSEVAENCRKAFLAGEGLSDDLTVLRTSLFFERRRWRHYGYDPVEADMAYIHALVEGIRSNVIRAKVNAGEID